MKTLVKLATVIAFLGLSANGVAEVAANQPSEAELASIKATCEADSHDAIDPAIYAQSCVEDKVKALTGTGDKDE